MIKRALRQTEEPGAVWLGEVAIWIGTSCHRAASESWDREAHGTQRAARGWFCLGLVAQSQKPRKHSLLPWCECDLGSAAQTGWGLWAGRPRRAAESQR